VDTVSAENSGAFKHFDAMYTKAMGRPATTNVYAPMAYDMLIVLALAMEAAGRARPWRRSTQDPRHCHRRARRFDLRRRQGGAGEEAEDQLRRRSSKLDFDSTVTCRRTSAST